MNQLVNKKTTSFLNVVIAIYCILLSDCANGQQQNSVGKTKDTISESELEERSSLLCNKPVWEELYQVKQLPKAIDVMVTEFQSFAAVNLPDKKYTYKISIAFDPKKKTMTEISDRDKPNYRLRDIYIYDENNKIKNRKHYDDELKGAGWHLNEETNYNYSRDKDGNFYDEVIIATDPRPGSDPPVAWKGKAFYNNKKQLIKQVERNYVYEYVYNEQGDITLEKTDGGTKDSRGSRAYKYTYDAKGNWIKKETYRTTRFMENVLDEVSIRSITY